jgi:hypothetical protein
LGDSEEERVEAHHGAGAELLAGGDDLDVFTVAEED